MSLMGTTKHQISFYGAGSKTQENDIYDSLSSDADDPDVPATKPLRPPYSGACSRAPKRIKRQQDPKTPTTCAAKILKSTTSSKEYRHSAMIRGRVPLANLGPTQGSIPPPRKSPTYRERLVPKLDIAGELASKHDEVPPELISDEECFDAGDIFMSTDQQQSSTLRNKPRRHDYDETTTEF